MRKSIIDKIMVLTMASFIIKALGFVFRIYLSNTIGSEGMGLYQLVLSVYAFGATLSTFGISTSISRLVAIDERHANKILKTGIIITEAISICVSLTVFLNAEYIGEYFIKDTRTITSVKLVALSFPAISLFSCLSGYFNGLTKVQYPIRGQIAEQIVRIVFIFLVISKAMRNGMESALNITSFGIVLGEYLSLMYLWLRYKRNLKNEKNVYTNRRYFKDIIKISIPLSANVYFQSFLHTFESILIPGRFALFGYTRKEAVSLLGMIKGMAMPLIFFPTVLISAVSTIILPHISKAQKDKDREGIKRAIKKSFALSIFSGLFIMTLFLLYSEKICVLIYGSKEVSHILKNLSLMVPMLYINISATGILNGLGKQLFLMIVGIIDGVVKIAMICLFIPSFGFYGYILTLIICETVSMVAYTFVIAKAVKY